MLTQSDDEGESEPVENLRVALSLAEKAAFALNLARDWLAWLWVKEKSGLALQDFDDWFKSKSHQSRNREKDFAAFVERLPAERDYWWRLDQPFREHLPLFASDEEDAVDKAIDSWRAELRTAAKAAWNGLIDLLESSPRTLSITARAGDVFEKQLNIALKMKGG